VESWPPWPSQSRDCALPWRRSGEGKGGCLIILGAALVALVIAAVAAVLLARRRLLLSSLPRVRGTLDAPGISAAVTISRDRYGVPHIDAARMEDAAYAMGVVH